MVLCSTVRPNDLVFAEGVTEPSLRSDRWVLHYLPHWTTPERSAARFDVGSGVLRLRIDADTPAWRPDDLFGSAVGAGRSGVRMGVEARADPRLHDDLTEERLDLDASAWHRYTVAWSADRADFWVDDRLVRSVDHIGDALQVMVDLFESPLGAERPAEHDPKVAEVRRVRGRTLGPRLPHRAG